MTYLEWVALVANAFAGMRSGVTNVVGIHQLRSELGLDEGADDAVYTAVRDLDDMTILDMDSIHWLKETDNTRRLRAGGSLTDLWPAFFERFLEPDEETFLGVAAELAHRPGETFADVEWVEHPAIFDAIGWDDAERDPHEISRALERNRFVNMRVALGGPVRLYPTYAGVVRATQRLVTEQHQLVKRLLEEWETTTVEFKRELKLGSYKQKAEFARDVTALANTKSSGATRYLVVGFDPVTHVFTKTFDRSINQDRLEQILDAWTTPPADIRLAVFLDASAIGEVGLIEVRRDPTKLPHRMKKGAGKIEGNAFFVRHGSHVVAPDPAELAELEAEGARARD